MGLSVSIMQLVYVIDREQINGKKNDSSHL